VYAGFLLLHYLRLGTPFFETHLQYMTFDLVDILNKLSRAASFIFIRHGRVSILILLILLISGLIIQKRISWSFIPLPLILITGFLLFSVFNFYTQRYGLVVMMFFFLIVAGLAAQLRINRWIKNGVFFLSGIICLWFSVQVKNNTDVDLGYIETTRIFSYLVHRCEAENLYDEPIAASFNMIYALKDPSLGYRSNTRPFTAVGDRHSYLEKEYFVYESTSHTGEPSFKHAAMHFVRMDSIRIEHAWGVMYRNQLFRPEINDSD
jgi:hypothetical protein